MGKRLLDIEPRLFIETLKHHGDNLRMLRVMNNALPDDARVVGFEMSPNGSPDTLRMVIESDEWFGDVREWIRPPNLQLSWAATEREMERVTSEVGR